MLLQLDESSLAHSTRNRKSLSIDQDQIRCSVMVRLQRSAYLISFIVQICAHIYLPICISDAAYHSVDFTSLMVSVTSVFRLPFGESHGFRPCSFCFLLASGASVRDTLLPIHFNAPALQHAIFLC